MGLNLKPGQSLFIDTAPFIYFFERKPGYFEAVSELFNECAQHRIPLVTSMVTYIELLTLPEKTGDHRLAARYREFLTNSEELSIYPLNPIVAEASIRYRVKYGMKTPDAIQLGVAEVCGVDYVVTNDRAWEGVSEVDIFTLTA